MGCKYIIVSSVTYAMKAKSEIDSHGIKSKVEKIKNVKKLGGCGYGLKLSNDDVSVAARYLTISGIKIVDIIDCEAKSR